MKTAHNTFTLKVDNLRHISDHGLAVEFTDKKLSSLIDSMRKDGEYWLVAGKSTLTVRVVGRVCWTLFHQATSGLGYNIHNLHYYSKDEDLKHRVGQFDGDGNSRAFYTLIHVIFGNKEAMPEGWIQSGSNGDRQDKMRDWLKKWAWTIFGESGLRGRAIKSRTDVLRGYIESCNSAVKTAERARLNAEKYDYHKALSTELESMNEKCNSYRDRIKAAMAFADFFKEIKPDQNVFEKSLDGRSGPIQCPSLGVARNVTWVETAPQVGFWGNFYSIQGQAEIWSHPLSLKNYDVSIVDDQFILSSGISCGISVEAARAWLAGETIAPRHNLYGQCSKIEARAMIGGVFVAVLDIRCGCHHVRLNHLPGFEEIAAPKHTVAFESGSATVRFDYENKEAQEAFMARLIKNRDEYIQGREKAIAEAVAECKQKRASLWRQVNNRESYLKDLDGQTEKAKAQAAEAVQRLNAFSIIGQNGDAHDTIAKHIINTMLPQQV